MKQNLIFSLVLSVVLTGCSGPKVIAPASISQKAIAEKAAAEGNYSQAVEAWKQYFNGHPAAEISGADYGVAAHNAFKTGDENLAVSWFDHARYKNLYQRRNVFNIG